MTFALGAHLRGPGAIKCIVPSAFPPSNQADFGHLWVGDQYLGRVTAVVQRERDGKTWIRVLLVGGWVFTRPYNPADWDYQRGDDCKGGK